MDIKNKGNNMKKLSDTITTGKLLRNTLRYFKYRNNKDIVWGVVADICGVGSTHAIEICEEIGVDPFAYKFIERGTT